MAPTHWLQAIAKEDGYYSSYLDELARMASAPEDDGATGVCNWGARLVLGPVVAQLSANLIELSAARKELASLKTEHESHKCMVERAFSKDGRYYCASCDRSFQSLQSLYQHRTMKGH